MEELIVGHIDWSLLKIMKGNFKSEWWDHVEARSRENLSLSHEL
jgi:hypothetical protein